MQANQRRKQWMIQTTLTVAQHVGSRTLLHRFSVFPSLPP
jgi:hypothetical protein